MDDNNAYRTLTIEDVDEVGKIFSQSYFNDPLCSFVLPNPRTRTRSLFRLFRTLGELSIKNNRVYGVGKPLEGVAFWKNPSQMSMSISVSSLGKLLPLLFTYYPIGLYRAREIETTTERLHQKYAAEPHFYLDNLAVLPKSQGKGLASKLIRPFLEMADTKQHIVYTDTVTHANVGLYEHFGFQCMEEVTVKDTGITVWALLRPAKKSDLEIPS